MKNLVILLLSFFFSSATFGNGLEWYYRTYPSTETSMKSDWMKLTETSSSIYREYQGFIEYKTNFEAAKFHNDLGIYLGQIGDVDKVYINNNLIGQTGDFPPYYTYNMDVYRQYNIPKAVLNQHGPNELRVLVYVKYFVNKGLNAKNVVIGLNKDLQEIKYTKDLIHYLSKLITPILCFLLMIISFPPFAPEKHRKEQIIIWTLAITSLVFSVCRGRIIFHYFDLLPIYKLTISSSIFTICLISVLSLGFNRKVEKALSSIALLISVTLSSWIILQNDLLAAAPIAKLWFHIAPMFLFTSTIYFYFKHKRKYILKAGLTVLTLVNLNDILHDLRYFKSIQILEFGFGLFISFLILDQILRLKSSWERYFKKENEFETEAHLGRQSLQLAHDIRSPLEALKSTKDSLQILPESERTSIFMAINRIEEIAYKLLQMRKDNFQDKDLTTHIQSNLEIIIEEKKMQYRSSSKLLIETSYSPSSFATFSDMNPDTFKRIISNIISNSAEALHFMGKIQIFLRDESNQFFIEILDNGPGISKEASSRIFERGFTTKNDGNGLGLFHAKQEIEAVNGKIQIDSDKGSKVIITLPKVSPASIFPTKIDLQLINKVIILDDDENIHQIWKKRFKSFDLSLEHHYSSSDLLKTYSSIPNNAIFLCDYVLLGESVNGIDCITKLSASNNSILVTALSDDTNVIKSCEKINLRLLPKNMALNIPISKTESEMTKVVLIDDDELMHISWRREGKKRNINVQTYFEIEQFIKECADFSRSTPIYIDSNLRNGIKGEIESEKIFNLGFNQLYLSTGYTPELINKPHWILQILGKQPNFNLVPSVPV